MLSWSSTESGNPADLSAVVDGTGDAGLPHGAELVAFAEQVIIDQQREIAILRAYLAGAEATPTS